MKNDEVYYSGMAGSIRSSLSWPATGRKVNRCIRRAPGGGKQRALAPTGQVLLYWNKIINGLSFANPQIAGTINPAFQVRRGFLNTRKAESATGTSWELLF
jgi:hypothetical protein